MPSDPWLFDDTAVKRLAREDVFCAATDKRGHASTLRSDVPPEVMSRIERLVASKIIPEYTTPKAFVRDAIYHRLQDIEDMLPGWVTSWPVLLAHLQTIELEAAAQAEDEFVQRCTRLADRAVAGRDEAAARVLAEKIDDAYDGLSVTGQERMGNVRTRLKGMGI